MVENANFGKVSRVVPDGDLLTDERGQGEGELPQSVTADAVTPRNTEALWRFAFIAEGHSRPA